MFIRKYCSRIVYWTNSSRGLSVTAELHCLVNVINAKKQLKLPLVFICIFCSLSYSVGLSLAEMKHYYAPAQGALSDDAVWRLSDFLTSIAYIGSAGGVCGRPAACIGWSGPARPAWLKAAAARFRWKPGWVHIVAAARLQRVSGRSMKCKNGCYLSWVVCWDYMNFIISYD